MASQQSAKRLKADESGSMASNAYSAAHTQLTSTAAQHEEDVDEEEEDDEAKVR
jgi:hypothetical protein